MPESQGCRTLAQVFSCEFCKIFNKIFNNDFFTGHLRTTASDQGINSKNVFLNCLNQIKSNATLAIATINYFLKKLYLSFLTGFGILH